jgi:hypothetical protein
MLVGDWLAWGTWKVLLTWENVDCLGPQIPNSRSTFRVKITGLCPRVRVDTSATAAIGQAGGVVLTRTVTGTGLDPHLSAALAGWRKRLAIHDPGKIITDLALSLALGGDCLADLALLRAEPGVYGRVASDPTVSRTIAALASDAPAVLKAIDSARAAAREQGLGTYWARYGGQLLPRERVSPSGEAVRGGGPNWT